MDKPGGDRLSPEESNPVMNCARALGVFGVAVLLVGCQPVTCQVKITNNSPFITDIMIQSDDDSLPTVVNNLAANGGSVTVSHTGTGNLGGTDTITISSGTLVGSALSPIDAQTGAIVTPNDLVTVVKAPTGELSNTVTAFRPSVAREVQRQAGKVLGK
jgi:hypothetical protein